MKPSSALFLTLAIAASFGTSTLTPRTHAEWNDG